MRSFSSILSAALLALLPATSFAPQAAAQDEYEHSDVSPEDTAEAQPAATQATMPDTWQPVTVQDYEPNPAIWKLSDEDTVIYMFGTIHVLPPEFAWRSPALDAIIEEADELVVETADAEMDMSGLEVIFELLRQTKDKPDLSDQLSPENKPKFEKLADQMGFPSTYLERMPAWLMPFMLQYDLADDLGSVEEYGVETVLEKVFSDAGKPIGSIEDGMAVFRALGSVDDTLLISELDEALTAWDGEGPLYGYTDEDESISETFFDDDHAWAKGEVDKMAEGLSREDLGDSFYQVLLVDRNAAWAEWLEKRLERPGTILLAVGAGHFAGDDSVQIMLEKRGLKAERLH